MRLYLRPNAKKKESTICKKIDDNLQNKQGTVCKMIVCKIKK